MTHIFEYFIVEFLMMFSRKDTTGLFSKNKTKVLIPD